MCTKNIGLTGARFARRVGFAHTKKQQLDSGRAGRRQEADFVGCCGQLERSVRARGLGQRAMKSREWKTYRTRFLVKAKQLNASLSFVDPLGRQHSGRKGDYLVESSDGVISIAPRQIFEDIYVPMLGLESVRQDAPGQGGRKLPQGCRDKLGASGVRMM